MMRITVTIFVLFIWNISAAQQIQNSDLIGCWEAIDLVDTLTLETIPENADLPKSTEIKSFGKDGEFLRTHVFKDTTQFIGTWSLRDNSIKISKTVFEEEDYQRVEDFDITLEEATQHKLTEVFIQDNYLYYEVFLDYGLRTFARYRKINCP